MGSTPSKYIKGEQLSKEFVSPEPAVTNSLSQNAINDVVKPETAEANFEQTYKNIATIMQTLQTTRDFEKEDLTTMLNEIIKVYYVVARSNMENLHKICSIMIGKGLLDLFVKIWDNAHQDSQTFYSDVHSNEFNNLNRIKIIFWNFSDKCPELAKACHRDSKVIERLMREYTMPELSVECLKDQRIRHMLKANLGILHNIVRLHSKNRDHIRKDNGIAKILEYDKSTYLIIKAKIFILLAYCINEDENEKLMTGSVVIKFIIKLLSSAVSSPNHVAKTYAFSAEETVSALNKLASNDNNKKTIADSDVLPLLTELLDSKTSTAEEHLESVNCIWSLAFHPDNKEKIIQETGLIERVKALRARAEAGPKLSKACSSLLFVLNLEEPPEEISNSKKATHTKHIMLSYNWEVQTTVLQLREFLKEEGYDVWMDVERMQDSILSAMADAVENAGLILVAMTESYKHSNSCRTEAEYSYKREIPILPLLLQPGYVADGWLGAMVGTKLYIDLSTGPVENKYTEIRHQIKSLMKYASNAERSVVPVKNTDVAKTAFPVGSPSTAVARMTSVDGGGISLARTNIECNGWSTTQVQTWVKNTGVKENSTLQNCDGIALAQICKMLLRSPETYYTVLREEVNLNFMDTLRFTDAVETLLFS